MRVESPRGAVQAPVRIGRGRDGVVLVPSHFGYWNHDEACPNGGPSAGRAANELTITEWDPVSQQPLLKVADATGPASAPANPEPVPATVGGTDAEVDESIPSGRP